MPSSHTANEPRITLFVSYSRKDTLFVDALVKALEARGYDVRIDRSDIRKGEEWWKRIVDLIVDAMLIVFIISPDSVGSPVCRDEVDLTKRLGKRIVPLLWRSAPKSEIPEGLAERDWVSFKAADPSGTWEDPSLAERPAFATAMRELEAAIRLDDVLWAEEHAQWLKRAMDWDRAGRPEGSLMRAGEITAAQSWANRRRQNAAAIPELVTDFLNASLAKEERDREELNARERRISAGQQRLIAEATRRAREAGRHDRAMRLALAGEPTEDELKRGVTPEPARRAQLAAAAHSALGVACLSGLFGDILRAGFSPDGQRLLVVSKHHVARMCDARNGVELVNFDDVCSVAFSPDGARVLTVSMDGAAHLWDAASGHQLVRIGQGKAVMGACFSPNGDRVLTVCENGVAEVCDATTGAPLIRLDHGDEGDWADFQFSPDGTRVLTMTRDGPAHVWDARSGSELVTVRGAECAFFSPSGARLLTVSWDTTAQVWDIASGVKRLTLGEPENDDFSHISGCVVEPSWKTTVRTRTPANGTEPVLLESGSVACVAFSPDGRRVLTAVDGRMARLWDGADGVVIAHLGHIDGATWSLDGTRILTISSDGAAVAHVWDAENGAKLVTLEKVTSAGFSSDGQRLLSLSTNGVVRVCDAASSSLQVELGPEDSVSSAAFSPDGGRVATTSGRSLSWSTATWRGGAIQIWDAANGRQLLTIRHDGEPNTFVFSPDGGCLLTRSWDERPIWHLWDVASSFEMVRADHASEVRGATFSPDGRRVITDSWDGKVRVWDATSGAELSVDPRSAVMGAVNGAEMARLEDTTSVLAVSKGGRAQWRNAASGGETVCLDQEVLSATFSPSGAHVLTTSSDGTARLWSAANGIELMRFDHDAEVRVSSAAFNSDGSRVLTAAGDTARVWDATSGVELARFYHDGIVNSAAFSADHARVVTASRDRTARVWDTTWVSMLTGERLVRAVARERLKGCGRLTEHELRILRPILGEVDPDVTSRWLAPSPDDAEIEAILAQWRRNREMALALAKKDWAKRAEEIRANLAQRRAAERSTTAVTSAPEPELPPGQRPTVAARAPQRDARYQADSSVVPKPARLIKWLLFAVVVVSAIIAVAAAIRRAGVWP
jgi:WD40 repeat protein